MSYVLLSRLKKGLKIKIGKLGNISFEKGNYLYVGSAKKGLESRIKRHLTKKKNFFWHIDYLLSVKEMEVDGIWVCPRDKECATAQYFFHKGYDFVKKFGSSDCRCLSHLFFIRGRLSKTKVFLKVLGYNITSNLKYL